jgi:hypothetical protein
MLRGPDHIAMRAGVRGTATTVVSGDRLAATVGRGSSRAPPEADLPTYRVTFRPLPGVRRLVLDLEADDLEAQRDGALLVLVRYTVLVLDPRLVVVLRVSAREGHVECLCPARAVDGVRCGRRPLD